MADWSWMCGIHVGLPKGQFFYVITLDQHVIHRRTRVINVKSQFSRSLEQFFEFPQKLSSVEFPVTFSQFLLNLDSVNPFASLLGVTLCWLKGSDGSTGNGLASRLSNFFEISILVEISEGWYFCKDLTSLCPVRFMTNLYGTSFLQSSGCCRCTSRLWFVNWPSILASLRNLLNVSPST